MTVQERFYEKLKSDYESFIDNLREMPPDKIIANAYEKVMKEEILSHFEDSEYLSDEEALLMYAQNVDLDDLYNNYKKMDVSLYRTIRDCNEHFVQERLEELPGQEIEGVKVANYEVKRAIMFENDRGFAFGHNPKAVDPFATWQFTSENNKLDDFYWGKYFSTEEDALANFVERATDYAQTNNVKEKPLPEAAIEEQDRLYKAEIFTPDEPEFPHLEVFHATDDVDAVNQAHELVSGEEAGAYLFEVHELDENYDSIRQIDLLNHDPELRRFVDVDLIDFLGQIADKTIIHHPNDFKIDIEELWKIAISKNPTEQRVMWHCSEYGTHILNEDEVFTKDTGAYGYWVTYRPNEPSMVGYVIEVTGYKTINGEDTVVGNVYEVGDYSQHAKYVKENALVLEFVSLTYSPDWGINAGKTITVPKFEYDQDRHRLMSESGNVTAIQYHPWEGIKTMAELLKYEQATRMAMPIGDPQKHLQSIADKMAELRDVQNVGRQHLDEYLPKIKTFIKDVKTAENAETIYNCLKPHYDKDGWAAYDAAKNLLDINICSEFPAEDNLGYFEELDGFGYLKWMEIAAFATKEYEQLSGGYEKLKSHFIDKEAPEYQNYKKSLWPLAVEITISKVATKQPELLADVWNKLSEIPIKSTPPVKKPQTFEELLKEAQAKADAINRQNALNKGQQPTINKNNIEIGE